MSAQPEIIVGLSFRGVTIFASEIKSLESLMPDICKFSEFFSIRYEASSSSSLSPPLIILALSVKMGSTSPAFFTISLTNGALEEDPKWLNMKATMVPSLFPPIQEYRSIEPGLLLIVKAAEALLKIKAINSEKKTPFIFIKPHPGIGSTVNFAQYNLINI